jgi:hypothetical protein
MGKQTPPGLSEEKAARMMLALREGRTLRTFGVSAPRLDTYLKAHPEYARAALPLIEVNKEAARLRKGDALRSTTHCRSGLHPMTADNVFIDGSHGRRRCLACRRASSAYAPLMSLDTAEKVKLVLQSGISINQIRRGLNIGGKRVILASFKIIKRYRRENPSFDRFVMEAINDRIYRPMSAIAEGTFRYDWDPADLDAIPAMLPERFPGKKDVVQSVFLASLEGRLDRSQVERHLGRFVREFNRQHPTKFAKFGNTQLVSLDEVMFEDGSTTRGDTVSRGFGTRPT